MLTKSDIRSKIKIVLSSISSELIVKKSRQIIGNLESLEAFKNAKVIMAYMPLGKEVNTSYIFDRYCRSKGILIPRVCTPGNMEATMYEPSQVLTKNDLGIMENTNSCAFSSLDKIDLIIVPGIAFDRKGSRIGRGMGCYDRFLAHANSACKIGLAFHEQILDEVPTAAHDIAMDKVVTEDQVFTI